MFYDELSRTVSTGRRRIFADLRRRKARGRLIEAEFDSWLTIRG